MEEQFDEKQQEAIERCVDVSERNRIVPITGPAGVGKTTIMRKVYNSLTNAGYRVALCAPMGKAARRIKEATGIPAMTIHKMLEYPHPGERDPKTGKPLNTTDPKRDRFYPLNYDVVLADEYATAHWELHRNILDALPRGGCLRTFGDVNQLKPIEKNKQLAEQPSPFMELIDKFQGVKLETLHRNAGDVAENANRILKGQIPKRLPNADMTLTDKPVDVLRDYVIQQRELGFDFSKIEYQIVTPMRKRWIGTAKLNELLQTVFRPELDGWIELPRHPWAVDKNTVIRVGDKVIWTENDYNILNFDHNRDPIYDEHGNHEAGVFNGETGIVVEVEEEVESFYIDFGDRIVYVPPVIVYETPHGMRTYDPRKSVDLAYAITTHKAQGSEFLHTCYVMNKSCMFMQTRANFYTGYTRSRNVTHVISDQKSLSTAVWRR